MTTTPYWFFLIPIVILAACIAFVGYAVRSRLRRTASPGAVHQIVSMGIALFLFANLGATLIAPAGPGSESPLYLTLIVPCVLFLILGPNLSRIMAGVVVCACLAGLVSARRERERFRARMEAELEDRRGEAPAKEGQGTEPSAPDYRRDAVPQPEH